MEAFEKLKAKIAELAVRYESSEDKKNSLIHERETFGNDREKFKDEFKNIQKEVSEMRAQVRNATAESKKVQSSKDVQERSKREKQKLLESVQKVLADTKSRYYKFFIIVKPRLSESEVNGQNNNKNKMLIFLSGLL